MHGNDCLPPPPAAGRQLSGRSGTSSGHRRLHRMRDDYGAPVSQRALRTVYIGGTLAVGLLTDAAFAGLSTAGWGGDTLPRPLLAFIFGFVMGVAPMLVGRRRRRRDQPPRLYGHLGVDLPLARQERPNLVKGFPRAVRLPHATLLSWRQC